MDVGLAGAEVAALDGVVEEAVHRVAVVAVVLGGVDAALGGDGVGAARGVGEAELDHVVALFGEGRAGRSARQAGTDDDDGVLAAVGGVDELGFEAAAVPAVRDRAFGGLGVGDGVAGGVRGVVGALPVGVLLVGVLIVVVLIVVVLVCAHGQFTTPVMTATGTDTKPAKRTRARPLARNFSVRSRRALPAPRVCAALQKPWRTCSPRAAMAAM